MKLIKWLIGSLVLMSLAYAAGRANIQFRVVDNEHITVSCANGADPAIVGAKSYNTIIVSCVDERR